MSVISEKENEVVRSVTVEDGIVTVVSVEEEVRV